MMLSKKLSQSKRLVALLDVEKDSDRHHESLPGLHPLLEVLAVITGIAIGDRDECCFS
jgi:hypothetical protein